MPLCARIRTGAAAWLRLAIALLGAGSTASVDAQTAGGTTDAARNRMIEAVAAMARETGRITGRTTFAPEVMRAMAEVPRDAFVPASQRSAAYDNRPLPIGNGQTISQPYIVALSTDLIDPKPTDVVLEVGTGSGYQAAILARLVSRVYSIEIVEALGTAAAERLRDLGYANVEVRVGDGYEGWPERAPFDAIVVTAAAPRIPEPLVGQLRAGGRMVIPVDAPGGAQELLLVMKRADGSIERRVVLPVRFVPFTGQGARGTR